MRIIMDSNILFSAMIKKLGYKKGYSGI